MPKNNIPFTEQYKQATKPVHTTTNVHAQGQDKSEIIKQWLQYAAQQIVNNDKGKYNVVYEIVGEECKKKNPEITLEQFRIGSPFPAKIITFLPNLPIQDIAEELERNTIEIAMPAGRDNPFHGCHLKVKAHYAYPNKLLMEDSSNPSNMILGSIFSAPFKLANNALQGKKLDGFSMELDPTPKPSLNNDDGCRIS